MSQSSIRFGVLTPSSNTALEPLTCAMLADIEPVSAHFSRFRVTQISLEPEALGQFDDRPILAAAKLLADAKVDVIGWSGTSAGWLGFEHDVELCQRIEEVTNIPATSSILALNERLKEDSISKLGLVSPYVANVQSRIVDNYQGIGISCVAESHLNISDNFAFAEVSQACLTDQVETVAKASPQAIVTYCTNLNAAHLVTDWESRLGIPVLDTTATVVWKMLRMTGVDPREVRGWGSLFSKEA
ncbi:MULTISPECIES: aspartate/glutamate racemase family protein [unclassified Halomonas]|uniref:maleate cis-trans isomerase family protein n=1 Tax=unclassified Halomonas TaxID=2609666 RepID=UPI001CF107C1|nr:MULTISPECIES: aspartate/glutamate racemase family protein [unclassified Halomonas]MCA8862708.1 Asp/Glu/hydantoin racemase [Halomonas sp. SBBP1]UZH09785.1 aspartate/glutamate racemase family protein [Halomonas sp. BDJS001]